MTTSIPSISILDDDAVAEIEARLKEWDGGAQHPASWNNVRALCQTVRVLRAEIAKLTTQWCECSHAKDKHGFFSDHDECYECDQASPDLCCEWRPAPRPNERDDLQSQLEQVTKERDRFSELADKRHDDLCEARRQRDLLAARHVEYTRDAMTAAIDDFRVHAVRLCRDKADEYDKYPEAAHALRAVAEKLEGLK